jgi:hypothetical protein
MNHRYYTIAISILILLGACSRSSKMGTIREFPLNSLDNIIATDNVYFDKDISSDNLGSLRIETGKPIIIPLFKITDLKIDNSRLVYSAKIRTQQVIGQVYLEMNCHLSEQASLNTTAQANLLSGSSDWKEQEASIDLQKGQMPDSLMLNLIINGRGIVWIDDIKLSRDPLTK